MAFCLQGKQEGLAPGSDNRTLHRVYAEEQGVGWNTFRVIGKWMNITLRPVYMVSRRWHIPVRA
jgi:hypothetical protein